MDPEVQSAIIAAGVSFVVGIVSYSATRLSIKSERAKLERELQRRLTEKLIDIRLETYPYAFDITDQLSGDILLESGLPKTDLVTIRKSLNDWHKSKVAFVLSEKSTNAYRVLLDVLDEYIKNYEKNSELDKREIWHAKNGLRRSLRADVNLLHDEETSERP